MSEPCMCGGCKRCLHDQGERCGDEECRQCNTLLDSQEESQWNRIDTRVFRDDPPESD